METKEISYEETDTFLNDLRRVVEDLESKSREFGTQEELESFNEELQMQINNVESLI